MQFSSLLWTFMIFWHLVFYLELSGLIQLIFENNISINWALINSLIDKKSDSKVEFPWKYIIFTYTTKMFQKNYLIKTTEATNVPTTTYLILIFTEVTHFRPTFPFYTGWKHQKTKGYPMGTLVRNGSKPLCAFVHRLLQN